MKFDWNDLLIQPAYQSQITSRSQINLFRPFPLMTSPMDTVINSENENIFKNAGIIPVLPRGVDPTNPWDSFWSIGLDTFLEMSEGKQSEFKSHKILVDIANGHMEIITKAIPGFLKHFPNFELMVGNVANPETFKVLAEAGVHYVRMGIGNGGGCLTTEQTGVGYPMASLIHETYSLREKKESKFHPSWGSQKAINLRNCKIVADGGFRTYSDIIKALALGADYVMVGGIFNKCLESAGTTMSERGLAVDQHSEEVRKKLQGGEKFYKKFRGMSTKEVQRSWGKEVIKTSEGISKTQLVEGTLDQWIENFEHYLRTAMSYTGKMELEDFIGKVEWNLISQQSFYRFNK